VINNHDPFRGVPVFLRVAEELSFRSAAARLGITPAAVSRTIQRLEKRLGVRLFERTTRTVRLTSEGVRYAARCREAVAQLAIGSAELQASRSTPRGTLVVSASPILAGLVVQRLARFTQRHPLVRTDLRLTDRLVRFAEDDVEVALRVGGASDASLVAHRLASTRWVTIASPSYLARRGTPRDVAALDHHDCLRFVPPRGTARAWTFHDADGTTVTRAVASTLDVDHGDLLVAAALAEAGIAQVLDFMVEGHLRARRLVEVLPNLAAPGPPIHAVHPPRPLPRVRAFVQLLADDLRARAPLLGP
jgi:LysR family transcriptional regulator, regulator for bpeEF and oprC